MTISILIGSAYGWNISISQLKTNGTRYVAMSWDDRRWKSGSDEAFWRLLTNGKMISNHMQPLYFRVIQCFWQLMPGSFFTTGSYSQNPDPTCQGDCGFPSLHRFSWSDLRSSLDHVTMMAWIVHEASAATAGPAREDSQCFFRIPEQDQPSSCSIDISF